MLTEKLSLFGFVTLVIGGGEAFVATGKAIVIEAGLADRNDLFVFRELTEGRAKVVRRFHRVRRMPSDDREDIWPLLSQGDRAFAAFDIGADANDLLNAGGFGSANHVKKIRRKIGVIKMSVSVVEGRHRNKMSENQGKSNEAIGECPRTMTS